jgi:hypothetical protein
MPAAVARTRSEWRRSRVTRLAAASSARMWHAAGLAAQAVGSAPAGTAHGLQHGQLAGGPASQVRSRPASMSEGCNPAQ